MYTAEAQLFGFSSLKNNKGMLNRAKFSKLSSWAILAPQDQRDFSQKEILLQRQIL